MPISELCVICEAAPAVDNHHMEHRARRPDLVDDRGNLLKICRSCHSRHHEGNLNIVPLGNAIRVENTDNGKAVTITIREKEISAGIPVAVSQAASALDGLLLALQTRHTASIAHMHGLAEQWRSQHKLFQWGLTAILRARARVVTTDRWDKEVARILNQPVSTVRNNVAKWDNLFPEWDLSEPLDNADMTSELRMREERLRELPSAVLERLARMSDAKQFIDLAVQQVAERGTHFLGVEFVRDVEREKGHEPQPHKVWCEILCPNCGHEWYGEAIAARWGTNERI